VLVHQPQHAVAAGAAASPSAQPQLQLTVENISKDEIERLKQLVLDGKRTEAIEHYVRIARVGRPDAEKAVNDLMLGDYHSLTRAIPLNTFGFFLYFAIIGVGVAITWISVANAAEYPATYALAGLSGVFVIWRIIRTVPKLAASWVASFGAEGRARVLKCAILRTHPPNGGTLIQVAFEVEPASGGHRFIDEEILVLAEASVEKLRPGNIIPVRYNEPSRQRVFPVSPVTVIGTAPN
jgi:hypothetical protein